eukprot:m.543903 g.543903  ORF g.543903 m.543903 type:complete len:412 (-) comp22133_c0_seq2:427-1662(-)
MKDQNRLDSALCVGIAIRHKIFYGYITLAIATVCAFFSGVGQTYGISAFIPVYLAEFGWSQSTVSSLYAVATCSSALMQPTVGSLVDRHGCRESTMVIASGLALACGFNAIFVSDWLSCAVGFFGMRLLGQGAMSLVPKTIVPRWFRKSRGKAMGILATGWMASQAFFPAINTRIIVDFGWRFAWKFWACCVLVGVVPLVYLGMVNLPEDIGLLPDGDPPETEDPEHSVDSAVPNVDGRPADDTRRHTAVETRQQKMQANPPEYDSKSAAKTRAFWILACCNLEGALVHTAVTFHVFSIVKEQQVPLSVAPAWLAARSVVGLPVNLLAGLANIALSTLVPTAFGTLHLGSINGLFSAIGVFGSALGPLMFGTLFDSSGSYSSSLNVSLIFCLVCTLAACSYNSPRSVHTEM